MRHPIGVGKVKNYMPTASAILAIFAISITVTHSAQSKVLFGKAHRLGNGTVKAYAIARRDGTPTAIGVVFKASMLDGLPPERNNTSRCFDLDKNGRINDQGECEGDYEIRLSLPDVIAKRPDVPFRWIALNWNPRGHEPKAWSVPHFDFHFYMVDRAAIDAIRVGPCKFFINCEDQKRATVKVPAKYVSPGFIEVKATVSMMGDHLVNSKTPEFAKEKPRPFTHTWIFGAYDGHITFYEPMITRAYLLGRPSGCHRIKRPNAWERSGYYPTVYCIRYSETHKTYTVSLEGMAFREAN